MQLKNCTNESDEIKPTYRLGYFYNEEQLTEENDKLAIELMLSQLSRKETDHE